jgi:hypothetical protein
MFLKMPLIEDTGGGDLPVSKFAKLKEFMEGLEKE